MSYTPKCPPGSVMSVLVAGGTALSSSPTLYRDGFTRTYAVAPVKQTVDSPANRPISNATSKFDFLKLSPQGDLLAMKVNSSSAFGFYKCDDLSYVPIGGPATSFLATPVTENAARWSPSGRYFGYCTNNSSKQLVLVDLSTYQEVVLADFGAVRSFDINDEYLAVLTTTSPTIRVYRLDTLALVYQSTAIGGSGVVGCALHPTLPHLAVVGSSTSGFSLVVVDYLANTSVISRNYSVENLTMKGVIFSPDGTKMVVFPANSTTHLFRLYTISLETGAYNLALANPDWLPTGPIGGGSCLDACFSPDSRYFAFINGTTNTCYMQCFDLVAGQVVYSGSYVGAAAGLSVTLGLLLRRISNENAMPVRDTAGNPVSGALVRAYRRGSGMYLNETVTDAEGRFILPVGGNAEAVVVISGSNVTDGSVVIDRVIAE